MNNSVMNGADCTYTFCELKSKEVINIVDGRRLGHILDMAFNACRGIVCGVIVPGERSFSLFKPSEDIFIPWQNILRIGEDVILVELRLNIPGKPPRGKKGGGGYFVKQPYGMDCGNLRPKVQKTYIDADAEN